MVVISIAQFRQTLAAGCNDRLVARRGPTATSDETRCGLFSLQKTPSTHPICQQPVFEGKRPHRRLAQSILPYRNLP
jgi:hypothetical protein